MQYRISVERDSSIPRLWIHGDVKSIEGLLNELDAPSMERVSVSGNRAWFLLNGITVEDATSALRQSLSEQGHKIIQGPDRDPLRLDGIEHPLFNEIKDNWWMYGEDPLQALVNLALELNRKLQEQDSPEMLLAEAEPDRLYIERKRISHVQVRGDRGVLQLEPGNFLEISPELAKEVINQLQDQ